MPDLRSDGAASPVNSADDIAPSFKRFAEELGDMRFVARGGPINHDTFRHNQADATLGPLAVVVRMMRADSAISRAWAMAGPSARSCTVK